jgi:hypothetical protein
MTFSLTREMDSAQAIVIKSAGVCAPVIPAHAPSFSRGGARGIYPVRANQGASELRWFSPQTLRGMERREAHLVVGRRRHPGCDA